MSLHLRLSLLLSACLFSAAQAAQPSPDTVSADAIRHGCSISFKKKPFPVPDDAPSTPLFSLSAEWHCRNGEHLAFDRYDVEGSSPQIATVLYWQSRHILVLVKWDINSRAADYSGSFYEIFDYVYDRNSNPPTLVKNEGISRYFPSGFDGATRNGDPVIYPFKNAASIRKRLRHLKVK